jgi:CheY-like chemotaxis protein
MKRVPQNLEAHGEGPRQPRMSARRDTILYVEDDDDNWEVAEYRLSSTYDMLRAANSKEACRLVVERDADITAILMDIELRGSELDGTELTSLFRGKRLPRPLPDYAQGLPAINKPIIFVTAHGVRYSDVELMLFGADKVIAKPVQFTALNLALASLQLSHSLRRR